MKTSIENGNGRGKYGRNWWTASAKLLVAALFGFSFLLGGVLYSTDYTAKFWTYTDSKHAWFYYVSTAAGSHSPVTNWVLHLKKFSRPDSDASVYVYNSAGSALFANTWSGTDMSVAALQDNDYTAYFYPDSPDYAKSATCGCTGNPCSSYVNNTGCWTTKSDRYYYMTVTAASGWEYTGGSGDWYYNDVANMGTGVQYTGYYNEYGAKILGPRRRDVSTDGRFDFDMSFKNTNVTAHNMMSICYYRCYNWSANELRLYDHDGVLLENMSSGACGNVWSGSYPAQWLRVNVNGVASEADDTPVFAAGIVRSSASV